MLRIFGLFILLISPSLVTSQSMLIDTGGDVAGRGAGLIETSPVIINETYKGTPYLNEDYSVISINKIEGETFSARFNAAADAMEILVKDGKAYNLSRDTNLEVTFLISNKKYRVFYYKNENNSNRNGYFVVLNDDDIKLLKKEIIKFHDEKLATNSYDSARPAEFKREKDKYYFLLKDQIYVTEVPKRKKDLVYALNLDSEKKDKVEKFMKKNRIKTNKEEGLIELFNYINTL
ncbi:hypothetical protein [Oceanihabitans sediminis]|uniref:DUF4369 domain-containing protein n=1 Tax=Oceanihabitans sediminis TaxID=1812012 RepID=A0A368P7H1_9FLAO|nr:hypothetical protein [Oceanihabitans sediminis]MDX1278696.1 hypothetical protein [Oceanihabitans sediminis]MDX1773009.1 hypothetical protein [Oceanihabitans sediminis]RBP34701.1 hypothetical protein DFR65_101598 [Oceanihabitans sediminis]RCU58353.1 hypothetical protein DU428_02970 [Oceanihabitans sediminis]